MPKVAIHFQSSVMAAIVVSSSAKSARVTPVAAIDHVHQAAFRGALFKPVMMRAVQLNEFSEVGAALAPTAVSRALALLLP